MANEVELNSAEIPYGGSGKIGACSWSLQVTSPALLMESLETTSVRALQIALMPMIEEPRIWTDVFSILRDEGVDVLSGMFAARGEDYTTLDSIRRTGGVCPDGTWPVTLEHALRVADLASETGLKLVTFHAGFIPHDKDDPNRSIVLKRIATVADVFAKRGVAIGLETGQETAATLLQVLEELAHPNINVNFDPANMILYGMGDPIESLKMLSQHVAQVHIKDALPASTSGTWGTEERIGEGAVDWDSFLDAVAALPRTVDLVIEREAGDQRISDIEHAYVFIESRLAERKRIQGSVR